MHRPRTAPLAVTVIVLALALAGAAWFWHAGSQPHDQANRQIDARERLARSSSDAPAPRRGHDSTPRPVEAAPRPPAAPTASAPVAQPTPTPTERRAAILDAVHRHERLAQAAPAPAPAPPTGELTKRIEGHDALFAELNADFMPLADECITDALERDPALTGTLALGVELVVDDTLGAVIESVDIPEHNEVDDPELHTCMRETLLSMILPAGDETSRAAVMLTLPLEPSPEP